MSLSSHDSTQPGFLIRHPWLFVLFAFVLLLSAWSTLIFVAIRHAPQRIEITRH